MVPIKQGHTHTHQNDIHHHNQHTDFSGVLVVFGVIAVGVVDKDDQTED